MNTEKLPILIVDDESNITKALTRLLRAEYQVHTSNDSEQALTLISQQQFAIIISDMRMPVIDGAELLAHARTACPAAIRILLTGFSDLDSTIRAINEGNISNYIKKPWEGDQLRLTLKGAAEHYRLNQQLASINQLLNAQNIQLQQANQQLAEQKDTLEEQVEKRTDALTQSNKRLAKAAQKQRTMFQHLLDMLNAIINDRVSNETGHNSHIAMQARLISESLDLPKSECTHIYLAAIMADIGKVGLSDALINKSEHQLTPAELIEFQQHVTKGANILSNLPNLAGVANIIRHQLEKYAGNGYPSKLKGNDIPIGARILVILKDYDRLLLGLKQPQKLNPSQAKQYLSEHAGHLYDPKIVTLYIRLLDEQPNEQQGFDYAITSSRLQIGSILCEDVRYQNDNLFLTKDTVISEQLLEKIKHYEQTHEQSFTFYVY